MLIVVSRQRFGVLCGKDFPAPQEWRNQDYIYTCMNWIGWVIWNSLWFEILVFELRIMDIQVWVSVARCKICCETSNGLARGCNHVSNNTADYSEYYCELWINLVVPDCDQCAEENPGFLILCTL